jgi:hypothetical protein
MKYRLDVTVNWKDGSEKTIHCNSNSIYNLKNVIGDFVENRDASSFVFVVVKNDSVNHTEEEN